MIFSGTVLDPKTGTPEWTGCSRRRPECGRMSCRKGLETPLAAGLAAGAGGLGSLEALAAHPWAHIDLFEHRFCWYFLLLACERKLADIMLSEFHEWTLKKG